MTVAVQPAGALLERLRVATRPAHDRLEGALGLLDDRLDLAAYTRLLERFYGFWSSWQPLVATLLGEEALSGPRRRLHLLAADLAAIGSAAAAVALLPVCPAPALRDAAGALGSLYVMEGSTLGGRVIRRHVERRLGFGDRSGCAYFSGYGENTGAMWRSFLARLELAPAIDAERIAIGATATFERLAGWLNRPAA